MSLSIFSYIPIKPKKSSCDGSWRKQSELLKSPTTQPLPPANVTKNARVQYSCGEKPANQRVAVATDSHDVIRVQAKYDCSRNYLEMWSIIFIANYNFEAFMDVIKSD